MWKAAVVFDGVRIPVKMYSVVKEQHVDFHLLHDEDQVRLQQQMVCESEDKPVAAEEIARGLEVDEGTYVMVEAEELKELEPEGDRSIEVKRFVPSEQVDPRYYDRPYVLGPDGEEEKYAAMAEALGKSKKVGVCEWVVRKRSYTGALRCRGGPVELVTLRLAEEIVPARTLEVPEAKLGDRERKMAQYLVTEMSGPFEPEKFHDEFHEALQELIRAKAAGKKVKAKRAPSRAPTGEDQLAKALEASVKAVRKSKQPAPGRPPRAAASRKRAA